MKHTTLSIVTVQRSSAGTDEDPVLWAPVGARGKVVNIGYFNTKVCLQHRAGVAQTIHQQAFVQGAAFPNVKTDELRAWSGGVPAARVRGTERCSQGSVSLT
jgi:hypothetical protein